MRLLVDQDKPDGGALKIGPTVPLAYVDQSRETLDPDKCAVMLEGMLPMDEVLRQSGHYGPRVDVPDDADVQTKLLAFIGRTP